MSEKCKYQECVINLFRWLVDQIGFLVCGCNLLHRTNGEPGAYLMMKNCIQTYYQNIPLIGSLVWNKKQEFTTKPPKELGQVVTWNIAAPNNKTFLNFLEGFINNSNNIIIRTILITCIHVIIIG